MVRQLGSRGMAVIDGEMNLNAAGNIVHAARDRTIARYIEIIPANRPNDRYATAESRIGG